MRSRRIVQRSGVKWSNETCAYRLSSDIAANGHAVLRLPIVPNAGIYGMRKAKNFDIQIDLLTSIAKAQTSLVWALLYLPEGVSKDQSINIGNDPETYTSLYEPNQHVIASGLVADGIPTRVFSPLARNLNSGDSILMVLLVPSMAVSRSVIVTVKVNYVISL
jgi:hypothetical protein